MALEKVGPFNPGTVDKIVSRIHSNERLKSEVIAEISRSGARAFIAKTFDLDARQRGEVELLQHRDIEDIFGRAFVVALVHNGSIKVIHEGHNPPNLWIQVRVEDGGVSVTVGC